MNQHRFARDTNFEIIKKDDISISFSLKSNIDTKKLYPYDFELIITYVLKGNSVEVKWNVINTDNKEIYFSIGAHPAFNIPINENNTFEDYYIMLKISNDTNSIAPFICIEP